MDIDDVYEWMVRGILAVVFVMAALVVILLLVGAINEVTYQIRRHRSQRERRTTTTTMATTQTPVPPRPRPPAPRRPSPSIVEELLQRIPDVEYLPLGDGGDGDGDGDGDSDDRESCVICVTPYEAGEACSVLPACKHLFHKACVAKWLRVRCTCPLCRAAVALPPLPHPDPGQVLQGNLNAAENMV